MEIRLIRVLFVKRGVRALPIVPSKPDFQIFAKLNSSFVSFEVDSFVFQSSPESFDKDVVPEASLAIHADFYADGFEHGGKGLTGKLAPLIGIEYLRGAIVAERLFQGLDTEAAIQSVGKPPGQNPSGRPDLVGAVNGQPP